MMIPTDYLNLHHSHDGNIFSLITEDILAATNLLSGNTQTTTFVLHLWNN